eukprot:gnl/MRDRNA2_/MRDRNA2_51879_c0_seq1.p1 gnl/MRDRNA2_/MRDRNA2_51879_c0~~gnl/MRDRNA2_/MRDRNA2_51879_c0_seq1.p1  ORF type:complete len:199 (-),score=50.95 gnl/MRDRNA2_/MRDRNA2_51879_c0_seq1:125-721(-)
MGGKGKGKTRPIQYTFAGKSKYAGPILETPPLYPAEYMEDVSLAEYPLTIEDRQLINVNRRLTASFKTSVYYLGRKSEVGNHPAKRRRQAAASQDHERQTQSILDAAGVPRHFFPHELLGLKNTWSDRSLIGADGLDLSKLKAMEKMDDSPDKEKSTKEKEEREPKKKVDSDAEEDVAARPPQTDEWLKTHSPAKHGK